MRFTRENVQLFFLTQLSHCLLSPTACLSSCNGRVRFVSTNFHNTLQWDAAEPATAGRPPLYTVKYKT